MRDAIAVHKVDGRMAMQGKGEGHLAFLAVGPATFAGRAETATKSPFSAIGPWREGASKLGAFH